MNLRKTILVLILILFSALMYTNFMGFILITQVGSDLGLSLGEFAGGTNAFFIWLQFPLSFLISIILLYLIFADDSLTKQNLRK